VQRITVRFPEGALEIGGSLAVLEREVACRLDAIVERDLVRLRPTCPERLAFDMAGGATGAGLVLRGLAGELVLPASGSASYALTAAAAVHFGGPSACEATLPVRLAAGAMTAESESSASCEDGELGAVSVHGALRIRHERLDVRRLGWRAGAGFDFDLALRFTPSYDRRWPALTLRDVVATPAGLEVVGIDARGGDERVGIGPAGLWPLRLREWGVPGQRIAWADWAGATSPITFGFTGALGLPLGAAPGLPPACAAALVDIADGRVQHDPPSTCRRCFAARAARPPAWW